MKLLDKLISFLFSLAILVIAITVVMVSLEYVTADRVYDIIDEYVFAENIKEVTLISAFVVILAVFKVTIFNSNFKSKDKTPILVESAHGQVEITQDTVDNTVRSVASTFSEIKDVQARMLKFKKGIKIYVVISVLVNTNLRELTENLQEKIEKVISDTIGVKVLGTNIRVKNIYEKSNKNKDRVSSTQETKNVEDVVLPEKTVEEQNTEVQESKEDISEQENEE